MLFDDGTREFALYDLDRNALAFYPHLASAEKARQSSWCDCRPLWNRNNSRFHKK
jgi:hypothetical protein